MAGEANRYRKWVYAGFGVGAVLLVLSGLSWFFGPAQDEDAIAVRLMILAMGFMVIVGSVIGLIATSGS